MTFQAVLLAGGKGTRLGARTRHTPKPLLDVGGQPFIEYLLRELARHGASEVVILVGPSAEPFLAKLGAGERLETSLTYITEPAPAGTGGALHRARDRLADRFLLLNADSWFDVNLLRMMVPSLPAGTLGRIALRHLDDTARFGRVEIAEDGRLRAFAENSDPRPGYINGGIYWLDRGILERLPEGSSSLEIDVFPTIVVEGRLIGTPLKGRFLDIGTPEDFDRAQHTIGAWSSRPAVFLDRDGVINEDNGYVHRPEQMHWTEGAATAIARLNDAGYFVFVVTNQAGVARGYYDETTVQDFHRWMNAQLAQSGAHIDAFFYCPHHPTKGMPPYRQVCDCRKPAPGMLFRAMAEWPIAKKGSFLIGDKASDLAAAKAAGVQGFRFNGGDLDQFVADCLTNLTD